MKPNYQELIKQGNSGDVIKNGNGINVGILDSGIFIEHSDFSGTIKRPDGWNIGRLTIGDTYGHGTHMAGIIGGRTKSESGIYGLAPDSIIYDLKIVESEYGIEKENLVNALSKIINDNLPINVLNISFNIDIDDSFYLNQLKPLLDKIYQKGIIMVCAAGDNDDLTDHGILTPAVYENAISVGTIESKNWVKFQKDKFHENLNYFFVNSKLRSCLSQNNTINKGNLYGEIYGSSPHTAVISGIIASNVNFKNKDFLGRLVDARNYLNSLSSQFSNMKNGKILTLYKTN